ncbi:MAG: 3-deoxy-7-phosphoheptulonate synthase [Ignavibacteriales bacterium]|nr:3-deoxy-7-phosphoheptulonate synthase [Ignavibacteriales bacterium]
MVVVTEPGVTEKQIEEIIRVLHEHGFDVHRSTGIRQTVLGAIGVQPDFDHRQIQLLTGVAEVLRITEPYKLASRTFKREGSVFDIGGLKIGGNEVVVMAGPCSVESEKQIFSIAESVSKAGAKILRGGAFKPRTSPYAFQGMGEEGLKLMRAAADQYGLKVITEVMDKSQIALVEQYADILQIGARNMQNFTFLRDLGKASKPILLKRGLAATIEEWLMSAEYILSGGNQQVMLCERGIRTFETATRNTMDIGAIPVVQKKSHLPIIADPSHAIGIRDKVIPMARASVAAGADGIIVEVHNDPDHAKSDGAQSLFPDQFSQMMKEVTIIAEAIGRKIA